MDGRYEGEVPVDAAGRWTLDITSAFPPGQSSVEVDVGDADDGARGPALIVVAAVVAAAVVVAVLVIRRRGRR